MINRPFRYRLRRDKTAAQWTSDNPTLDNGEPGIESDTGLEKIGDGTTAWTGLPYTSRGNEIRTTAYGSEPSAASGDVDLYTDTPYLSRYNGSNWIPWGPLFPLTKPDDSAFSWVNQGGASKDATYGIIDLKCAQNDINQNIRGRVVSIVGSTPRKYTACILPNNWRGNYQHWGMVIRASGSGKMVTFGYWDDASNLVLRVTNWDSATAINTHLATLNARQPAIWFRFNDDGGSNRNWEISADRLHWEVMDNRTSTDFITPDQIGFFVNQTSGNPTLRVSLISWQQT